VTIVVGYIPTPEGLTAVEYATRAASEKHTKLVIVNSGVHGNDTDPSFASAEELDALSDRLTAMGVEHEVRQPLQAESPADEILNAADELDADMIVIGLRRRSLVGKLFLGSTSQQIIIDAECPVVSVKRSV
jgi:nucleotide-binding universal stress UspA family protein